MNLFRSLILFSLLFYINISFSQESFLKQYRFDLSMSGPAEGRVYKTLDGGILMSGFQNNDRAIILKQIDDSIVYCKSYRSTLGITQIEKLIALPDKGVFACGRTEISFGVSDYFVMRTDSLGNVVWLKTYSGGTGAHTRSAEPFGDYTKFILSVRYANTIGVLIIDDAGNFISLKRIPSTIVAKDIVRTPDSGYILGGVKTGSGDDALLVKIDSLGNIMWSKTYGWAGNEDVYSAIPSFNGGYLIMGVTRVIDSNGDLFLIEVDSSGNYIWSKIFNTANSTYPYDIKSLDSTYVVAAGSNYVSSDYNSGILICDKYGYPIVSKEFDDPGGHSEFPFALEVLDNSRILMCAENINTGMVPEDYIDLYQLNFNGSLGCNSLIVPLTINTLAPTQINQSLAFTSHVIGVTGTSFNVANVSVVVTTPCYCANMPTIGFNYSICYDNFSFFSSISSPSYSSLQWDFGDGTFSNLSNPVHTYLFPGTYLVKLSVTGSTGCDNVVSEKIINVLPLLGADYTFSTDGLSVDFINNSPSSLSWQWDFGDGYNSILENPSHTYLSSGNYNVCLIASDTCGADTICSFVNVNCISITPSFGFDVFGGTVTFTDSTEYSTVWNWDFGDGTFDTVQNPIHNYSSNGNYLVCLYVSNSCSADTICDSIAIVSLSVNDPLESYDLVQVFPNPFSDNTSFIFDKIVNDGELILFNIHGQSVKTINNISGSNIVLNRGGLVSGVYFFELCEYGKLLAKGKLIVTN